MPASLFADVMPERQRRRPGALPFSLALHGLAIVAVASVAASPVAVEMPAPSVSGPIVFTQAPPRPETGRPAAQPPRLSTPPSPPSATAPGPAPAHDSVDMTSSVVDAEAPTPCLRNCGDADSPGSGNGGDGLLTPEIGEGGAGGGSGPPLPVGGRIRPPLKLHDVAPAYPELARRARVQGMVVIRCVIDADGRVVQAEVLRGVPLLDAAALEAVRHWTYRPTLLNGSPVAVSMNVTVQFSLQG